MNFEDDGYDAWERFVQQLEMLVLFEPLMARRVVNNMVRRGLNETLHGDENNDSFLSCLDEELPELDITN